jgi:hypothetical protein
LVEKEIKDNHKVTHTHTHTHTHTYIYIKQRQTMISKNKRCQSLLTFQTRDLDHHTGSTIYEKKLWSSTPEKWNVEGDLKKTRQKNPKT